MRRKAMLFLLPIVLLAGGCTVPTEPEPTPTQARDGLLIQIMDDGSILVIRA